MTPTHISQPERETKRHDTFIPFSSFFPSQHGDMADQISSHRGIEESHHGYAFDARPLHDAAAAAADRHAYTSSQATDPHSSNISSTLRPRSQYTFKHLAQMVTYSTNTPLRVIAHVDLDAFYAQCEQVRLGLPADTPLAVQQWGGLIAINYPARACGLTRFINLADARRLCPELICQHVATWKEGESGWAYRDDAALNMGTQKVSLDPYRAQSRRILACIKNTLAPGKLQRVEKASVDEVFMDLSAQVHEELLRRYPEELKGPPPYDDPTESLPRPPATALNWQTDALIDLDADETEEDDLDWDDIVMLIASEIVRDVRAAVREEVQYTCSAGIARNKMLAKLGSGCNKPNRQTVIRNRAIAHFLHDMKFTKIRNLGGKLGDEVVAAFGTDAVKDLLNVPLEQLRRQLGDDTGTWLYQIVRGEDDSDVTARTQIKSMLSAKSFRPTISSLEVARRWLRIFVADIFSRLVDDGLLEKRRRPRTLNLHHRQVSQMRSRQAPIPVGRPLDEGVLFEIARTLLAQVVADGRAWPCSNLSLSVGGFEEVAVAGNRGIGGFLVRGEEAVALMQSGSNGKDKEERGESELESESLLPPGKRRRTTSGGYSIGNNRQPGGIARFFSASRDSSRGEDDKDVEMNEERSDWNSDTVMLRHQDSVDSLDGREGLKQRQQQQQQQQQQSNHHHLSGSRSSSSPKRRSSDFKDFDNEDMSAIHDDNIAANLHTNTRTNDNANKTSTTSNTTADDPWSTPPSAQPPPRQDTSSFEKQSPPPPAPPSVTEHTPSSSPPRVNIKENSTDKAISRTLSTKKTTDKPGKGRSGERTMSTTAAKATGRPLQPSTSTLNRSKTYFDGKPLQNVTTAAAAARAMMGTKDIEKDDALLDLTAETEKLVSSNDYDNNIHNNNNNDNNDNNDSNGNGNSNPKSNHHSCPRCAALIPTSAAAKIEHQDWHLAKDLQDQEDEEQRRAQRQAMSGASVNADSAGTGTGTGTSTGTGTGTMTCPAPPAPPAPPPPATATATATATKTTTSRTTDAAKRKTGRRGRPPGSTNAATAAAAARTGRGQMRLGFGP